MQPTVEESWLSLSSLPPKLAMVAVVLTDIFQCVRRREEQKDAVVARLAFAHFYLHVGFQMTFVLERIARGASLAGKILHGGTSGFDMVGTRM